uniref:RxLR effector candidate protein n=3 Tax=Hyaloperonospora arabidopsidis (strain Emoy2) TaxID=559515 RepID=M4BNT6_HYAAE
MAVILTSASEGTRHTYSFNPPPRFSLLARANRISMRFQKSILLPLATFAACCSTNTMAERRLRSDSQVQTGKENQSSGSHTGAVGLSKLQEMDPKEVEKQVRTVVTKLPLPPGFSADSMVKLTMASLGKTKTDPKFAEQMLQQTDKAQEKMEKREITGIEDLSKMGKKAGKEVETGGAK